MTSRRILIVQDFLRSGGTERQSIHLAREFRARGHVASLLTFRPGGALDGSLGDVPRVALQPFDTGLNWFAPGLGRAVRRAAPDVVLLMGRMAHALGAGLPSAIPAARVVTTLRTGKPLPRRYELALCRSAHVVANSAESAARLLGPLGLPADRVSVIHNALVFQPVSAADATARSALREREGLSDGTPVMLCVGMFRPEKNQRALIEAAARLPAGRDWRLWFVGDGPEREACAALCRRLGVADRVRFLGFQSDPRPLYAAADLAVLASRAESLSNFLIEAQAHGLPAVAARATGVDECVREGLSARLVGPDDPAAMAEAMLAYLCDPAERLRAGRLGAEHARSAFAPAARADDYLRLFERLLSPRFVGHTSAASTSA